MKKQLTVALGLAVLATPAFATKARLQGLGEDIYGSFYVNDNRNIWLNAAQINNHKDMVTFEWGDNANTADQNSTPRAEGGVTKAMGNLVYGVHFGSASNTANQLRAAAGAVNAGAGTVNEGNNVDVFVGGDAGLKWGANLGYSRTSDQSAFQHSESMRTRLGVIMGDTQVYANVNLINNARGTLGPAAGAVGAKFEGKLGYQVGAIHAWEGNTFTIDFRQFDGEGTVLGNKEDQTIKQAFVGWGRVTRLNDKTNLFTRASFLWADAENDQAAALSAASTAYASACGSSPFFCAEYKTTRVPVVIGLETEATSWLTFRGSVVQSVWGKEEVGSNERTIRNNTVVNAGATLKFGELSIDGLVSSGDGTSGTLGETTAAGNGTLRLDQLMTRVGVNYRF